MKSLGALFVFVAIGSAILSCPLRADHPPAPKPFSTELCASPEMQKLIDAFVGDWVVSENFEVSASRQDQTRQGTASFRAGPGFSLIEDYKSNGSAGELNFLGILWWDQAARVYRLLTCVNNDG